MYGVVLCPRCRRARGVDLSKRTATCVCGSEIRVRAAKAYARVDTARELIEAVRHVQARVHGGLETYRRATSPRRAPRPSSVHARVAAAAARAGDRAQKVRAAALGLSDEIELFTLEDLRRVLDAMGIPGARARLQELLAGNVVYEPRAGYYRAVALTA